MTDDQQAKNDPETTTPDAPVPSADQKTPTDDSVGEGPPKEVSSQPDAQDGALPEIASERTKREFEKLRRELSEERQKRLYAEGVFQQIQPKPVYDPETGLIDGEVLSNLQKQGIEAEKRAKLAEEKAQAALQEIENREVFQAHPELNPDSKDFDRKLHTATRRILLDSMLNPDDYGGKQLSFKEAADLAKNTDEQILAEAKKKGAEEAMGQLTPKEQASLEAQGAPQRRQGLDDLEELRERTRKGDPDAVIARLKALEEASR